MFVLCCTRRARKMHTHLTRKSIIIPQRSESTSLKAVEGANALQSVPKESLAIGAAILAALVGGAAVVAMQNEEAPTEPKVEAEPEPEPEPIDVSIPYDAAARLAFGVKDGEEFDEARFAKFKELYEKKTVAEVTAKKLARDLDSF